MPRKRTISPRACKMLYEGATPQGDTAPNPLHSLPATFPSYCLDEEQLHEIEEWWEEWANEMLQAFKCALTLAPAKHAGEDAPANLRAFIARAVIISHMLRLHPATEAPVTELAKALNISRRSLYDAREAVLEQLGEKAIAAARKARQERDCALDAIATHPALVWADAKRLSQRVILVPFDGRPVSSYRFGVMQQIAAVPGVDSLREDWLDDGRRALNITLKP